MAIVNASGVVQSSYTYDVYGEATVSGSLANEFDFAGQQTDGSTGLQYLRARYMDPETGTFLSRDPLAVLPGWGGNPYGYVNGQPCNASDPTGLWPNMGKQVKCLLASANIENALKSLRRAAKNWKEGGYGKWDFSNPSRTVPMTEEIRKGHYENYANKQVQLGKGMQSWHDNDCDDPDNRPPGFDSKNLLIGEYFLKTSLDQAARAERKGKQFNPIAKGWNALVDFLDELEEAMEEYEGGGFSPGGVPIAPPVPVLS